MNPYFRTQTTEKELKLSRSERRRLKKIEHSFGKSGEKAVQTEIEEEKNQISHSKPSNFQMMKIEKAVQTLTPNEEKIISRPKKNTDAIFHLNRLNWTLYLQESDKLLLHKIMGKTSSRVVKIVKCHNQTLFQRYMSNKIEIEQDYPGAVMFEKFGFHGTSPEILGQTQVLKSSFHLIKFSGNIFANNFDERLSNPGFYGAGIYFASDFEKAAKFSCCAKHRSYSCNLCSKFMIIAKIFMGVPFTIKGKMDDDRWGHPPASHHRSDILKV